MQTDILISNEHSLKVGKSFVKYFVNKRCVIIPKQINLLCLRVLDYLEDRYELTLQYNVDEDFQLKNIADSFYKVLRTEDDREDIAKQFGFSTFDRFYEFAKTNSISEYDDEAFCPFVSMDDVINK